MTSLGPNRSSPGRTSLMAKLSRRRRHRIVNAAAYVGFIGEIDRDLSLVGNRMQGHLLPPCYLTKLSSASKWGWAACGGDDKCSLFLLREIGRPQMHDAFPDHYVRRGDLSPFLRSQFCWKRSESSRSSLESSAGAKLVRALAMTIDERH
jgi:hypothetical protein